MTWPLAFRKHVLKTKEEEGLTYEQTSKKFNIGISSLFRWNKQLEPKTTWYKRPVKLDMQALKQDIESYPDAYQRERAARLNVSKHCIWKALKRLGVTYKKNPLSIRKLTLLPVKNSQRK